MKASLIGMNQEFRFRGEEQSRIETFSDAVFALAITMLIVSTQVPKDFNEMLTFMADVVPFGLCMALIVYIWHEHFVFFLRYGFRNTKVVVLNALLLFFILFYVFPLKFLAKLLVGMYGGFIARLLDYDSTSLIKMSDMIEVGDMSSLMVIYGLGATAIFILLLLMYRYALKQKDILGLNEIEVFDTRSSIYTHAIMASVPALSALVSLLFGRYWFASMISGFLYMAYPIIFSIYGRKRKKKRQTLLSNNIDM